MEDFVVFFWGSKKTVSFAGKGALLAKRWIWCELDIDSKIRPLELSDSRVRRPREIDARKGDWHADQPKIVDSTSNASVIFSDLHDIDMLKLHEGSPYDGLAEPSNVQMAWESSTPINGFKNSTGEEKQVNYNHDLTKTDTNFDTNKDSNVRTSGVIEKASPLSSQGKIEIGASNDTLYSSTNNLIEGCYKQCHVTQGKETVPKEEGSLLNWCRKILTEFSRKPAAVKFLEPVDWVRLGLPQYPMIIKNPIDLGTIKNKLDQSKYSSIFEFDKDMRLVWSNAKKFNEPGSGIYKHAEILRREWNKTFCSYRRVPEVAKTYAKKARRSKPKRSPRSKRARKFIPRKRKHKGKLLASNAAILSPIDQPSNVQDDDTIPSFNSPNVSKSRIKAAVGKQSTRNSSVLNVTLSVSPKLTAGGSSRKLNTKRISVPSPKNVTRPNNAVPTTIKNQIHVCFRWRKGRCRKGISCPYKHYEEKLTHNRTREKTQEKFCSSSKRDRDKTIAGPNNASNDLDNQVENDPKANIRKLVGVNRNSAHLKEKKVASKSPIPSHDISISPCRDGEAKNE